MNRRHFLRTSGLGTAAMGGLVLGSSPLYARASTALSAAPDMAVFSAGSTAYAILIANMLAGKRLASDWTTIGTTLRAVQPVWLGSDMDAVLASALSRSTAIDNTSETHLQAVLEQVQVFHQEARLSQLADPIRSLEETARADRHQVMAEVREAGVLRSIQEIAHSSARLATEIQGFTVSTDPRSGQADPARLRRTATLSNVRRSISLSGLVFSCIATAQLPPEWGLVTRWSAAATVAAGLAAQVFDGGSGFEA